jgi:argininosuccinate synthase
VALEQKNEYVKVASYEGRRGEVKKVVLLYSGGLDTSTMIKWIQDVYKAEVVALTIDIGQQADDMEEVRQKALMLGAVKAVVIDAKDEFARDYITRGIKANGQYQGEYYLATPLGRPLLAKWAVRIAAQEGADAIAHGCTGKGNDQIRIEGSALALNPDIKVLAPVREWGMGRDEEIEYAKAHGIPVKQTAEKPYSYDDNMWGISGEGGEIENPALIPPLKNILQVCNIPEEAPDQPQTIELEFEKGIPVAIDGEQLKLADLIARLNTLGAKHGVGVSIIIEDKVVGLKNRNIYEAPAAHIIVTAHKTLEGFTATARENEFKAIIDQRWGYLCYGAMWFEPLMDNLNAYIDKANDKVTGRVTVKLYKGSAEVLAVDTPHSIYDEKLATYMKSSLFNQNASAGFIEHYTLQMKLAQRRTRTALLSVGGRDMKLKFLPHARRLRDLGYQLYATYKTHKFLLANDIEAILVNKSFDLIVSIPTKTERDQTLEKERTDGHIIRAKAVSSDTPLITELSVAQDMVNKLAHAKS